MPLDPDCRRFLEIIGAVGNQTIATLAAPGAREAQNRGSISLAGRPPSVALVEPRIAPGPAGPIPLRLYRPTDAARLPGILFLHGGGWTMGNLDTHDTLCRTLANATGAAVIAVDYRLAPEDKFPAAFDDGWAALRHVAAHAAEFGIDPHGLAICGDSAGGNLAAALALQARDHGGPRLAAQILLYPVTDMTMRAASHRENATGFLLTAEAVAWYRDRYLRAPDDQLDWRASPLLAGTLAGLPPACILTAGCDPLRDEGDAYAARLRAAGVPVAHLPMPGFIHGFLAMRRVIRGADQAIRRIAAELAALTTQDQDAG